MQAVAAHICYLLAGVHPQPFAAASHLCLLGGNHRGNRRCYASVAAMQRTQVLEWARSQGTSRACVNTHVCLSDVQPPVVIARGLKVGLSIHRVACLTCGPQDLIATAVSLACVGTQHVSLSDVQPIPKKTAKTILGNFVRLHSSNLV